MTNEVQAPPDPIGVAMDRGEELEDAISSLQLSSIPPATISSDDANAVVFFIGHVETVAAKVLAAAQAFADHQAKRVAEMMRWYGPGLKAFAQEKTAKKNGRTALLPLGSLSLRKEPDRLVQQEGDVPKQAFKLADARSGHEWSRVKAWFEKLSPEELDIVMNALPDQLVTKFHYEREPLKKEIADHWKKTGEVLPGFEVKLGEDKLTVDFTVKESAT